MGEARGTYVYVESDVLVDRDVFVDATSVRRNTFEQYYHKNREKSRRLIKVSIRHYYVLLLFRECLSTDEDPDLQEVRINSTRTRSSNSMTNMYNVPKRMQQVTRKVDQSSHEADKRKNTVLREGCSTRLTILTRV